jgi:hypothetical protein
VQLLFLLQQAIWLVLAVQPSQIFQDAIVQSSDKENLNPSIAEQPAHGLAASISCVEKLYTLITSSCWESVEEDDVVSSRMSQAEKINTARQKRH